MLLRAAIAECVLNFPRIACGGASGSSKRESLRAAGSKPFFDQFRVCVAIISCSANVEMSAFVSYDRTAFAVVLADFERLTSIGALCLRRLSLSTREWELQDIQIKGSCWIIGIWKAELAKELSGIARIAFGTAFAS